MQYGTRNTIKDSKIKGEIGMKIAMIGHKRIPSRNGGVEVVVEELSKKW